MSAASTRFTSARSSCVRRSGDVSTTMFFPRAVDKKTEVRSRLLAGFVDWQIWQLHPKIGTPVLVPDPKMVSVFILLS